MTYENESPLSIPEQALRWWVANRDESVTAAERREFGEWVMRGPERIEAYLRVSQLQTALGRRELCWPDTPAEALVREALAAPEEPVPFRLRPARTIESERRAGPRVLVALAASLVMAVLLGWLWMLQPRQFETHFGEQRSVLLSDGSRVTLNTASKIEVRMQKGRRTVDLISGQALFEVAHDPDRPFEVHAGHAVARAVGTQFDVDMRSDRTVVTVVEGRVAMLDFASGERLPLPVLSMGDRVIVRGQGMGDLQHGVDPGEATAWTRRQIIVRARPLGEVADEFNRYNSGRIDIRSPKLRALEITATFRSNDPASFIAFIEGVAGARVVADGQGGYIVTLDESETPGN